VISFKEKLKLIKNQSSYIVSTQTKQKSVFILGLYDTGLYVGQTFGRLGIQVFGFDHNIKHYGFKSKYIRPIRVKNPLYYPLEVLNTLIAKSKEFIEKPCLIPTSDEYLEFIAKFYDLLTNFFDFITPPPEVILKILNKYSQIEMAIKSKLNVPLSFVIKSNFDLVNVIKNYNFNYPVIIKPYNPITWKNKLNYKAFLVDNKYKLFRIGKRLLNINESFIIQRCVSRNVTHHYEYNALCLDGRIMMSLTTKRFLEYPPFVGSGCIVGTCFNKDIEQLGRKFILKNQIEGFCNIEFRYDPIKDKYYFIEINSRVWLQIAHTNIIGYNFLLTYYNFLTQKEKIFCLENFKNSFLYDKKILWIDLINLFKSFLFYDRFSVRKLIKLLFLSKISDFGLLKYDDIKPFISAIKNEFLKK